MSSKGRRSVPASSDYAELDIRWRSYLSDGSSDVLKVFPKQTAELGFPTELRNMGAQTDYGEIPWTAFQEPRVLGHGQRYYGGVFGERVIQLPIFVEAGTAADAMDVIQALNRKFGINQLGQVITRRKMGDNSDMNTEIDGVIQARRAFTNAPGVGVGVMGDLKAGQVYYVASISCPDPFFRKESGEEITDSTSTSGGGTVSLTNMGDVDVGVRLDLSLIAGGPPTSVTLTHNGTGRTMTVTDDLADDVRVEWHYPGPDDLSAVSDPSGTPVDIMGSLNVGADLMAGVGPNTWTVAVAGAASTVSAALKAREAYSSP